MEKFPQRGWNAFQRENGNFRKKEGGGGIENGQVSRPFCGKGSAGMAYCLDGDESLQGVLRSENPERGEAKEKGNLQRYEKPAYSNTPVCKKKRETQRKKKNPGGGGDGRVGQKKDIGGNPKFRGRKKGEKLLEAF